MKVHLEVFKHLATLATAVSLILLTVGGRFERISLISVFGVLTLALSLLLCVAGMGLVSWVVRDPIPTNLAFWISEALLILSCILFLSFMLTTVDTSLQQYGHGIWGWLRLLFGG